jgi:hypothetical protein
MASGAAQVGSGLYGLFGDNKNPADEAQGYLGQISGKTNQYNQPYFNAGTNQLGQVNKQYTDLQNDPGGKYNEIGSHYKESPGFKFAMQQALQGAGHGAAAGGMAGSPQHEQQNMQLANDIASQDYNKYMQGATGLYGEGLHGGQTVANQGQQAGQSQQDMIAQQLAAQGDVAYKGAANQNEQRGNAFSNIASGIGDFFY